MYAQLLSSYAILCNVPAGLTPGRKANTWISFALCTGMKYLFHMLIWSTPSDPSISLAYSSRVPSWNCQSKWKWMTWIVSAAFMNIGIWSPVSVIPCHKNLYLYGVILELFYLGQYCVPTAYHLPTLASFWWGVIPSHGLYLVWWKSLLPTCCLLLTS